MLFGKKIFLYPCYTVRGYIVFDTLSFCLFVCHSIQLLCQSFVLKPLLSLGGGTAQGIM